jgi:hypothetical protein
MSRDLWDRHDIAAFLGIQAGSVNGWLYRHGVAPVDQRPAGHGALKNLYRPSDVRAAQAAAPGRGWRGGKGLSSL